MESALAGCLRPTDQAEVLQYSLTQMRDITHLWPFDARDWIQIDAQFIGMFQVDRTHRMRMQFQAAEIGHPYQRGGIAWHDFLCAAPGGKFDFDDVDPGGPGCRRTLLIKKLAFHSIRVAHHHVRPPTSAAQSAGGHFNVIAHHIDFGVTSFREQHLVRIRDRNVAAVNAYQFVRYLRHSRNPTTCVKAGSLEYRKNYSGTEDRERPLPPTTSHQRLPTSH